MGKNTAAREEDQLEQFSWILRESENVVFLGGAGVSTESGIPDFRSKNGLYHKTEKRFSRYRPEVTLYGEMLPGRAYEAAVGLIRMANCLISGGTSLEVGSAAQLAHMDHGRHLVIINKSKTRLEGKADIVFHDSIGKILKEITDRLGEVGNDT